MEEGHGDPTVLGLLVGGEQRVSQPDGDTADQVDVVGHPLERLEGVVGDGGGPSKQEARALGRTEHCRSERGCGRRAQHDLAGCGGSLHGHDGAGPRTGNDELTVRGADEEEVEDPAVDPHRHPQGDPLAQDGQAPDLSQRAPHLDGGAASTRLMGLTGEEEQQGVTAELEQPAPVGDGQVEQGDEAGPDGGGELLGPNLPVPGQTFGQFGETRDVDEDDRADLLLVPLIGRCGDPVDDQPGEVGRERVLGLGAAAWRRGTPRCAPKGLTHGLSFSSSAIDWFEGQLCRQPLCHQMARVPVLAAIATGPTRRGIGGLRSFPAPEVDGHDLGPALGKGTGSSTTRFRPIGREGVGHAANDGQRLVSPSKSRRWIGLRSSAQRTRWRRVLDCPLCPAPRHRPRAPTGSIVSATREGSSRWSRRRAARRRPLPFGPNDLSDGRAALDDGAPFRIALQGVG